MTEEIEKISEYLKAGWASDIGSQIQYLTDLSSFKARINELKVVAEGHYIDKLNQFRSQSDTSKMKQYEYRDLRDVFCKDAILFKTQCDNLSGTIETQSRALITIISHAKEEMKMLTN